MKKKHQQVDWLKPGPQYGPSMWDRAGQEVGLTTLARLRWLVENFAEYGGSDVPADEMANTIAAQVCYFVIQQGATISTTEVAPHLSAKTLQDLAAQVSAGLDDLLDGKGWVVRVGPMQRSLGRLTWPRHSRGRKSPEIIHDIYCRYEILDTDTKVSTKFTTIFIEHAMDLIYASEPWRLGRCMLKECKRRFVRHDQRQVYCSTACSQVERTSRYKKRLKRSSD